MSRCTLFTESTEGLSQKEEVVQVTSLPISGMIPSKPETEGCSTLAVAGHRQGALPLPLVTSYSQADLIVSSITHSSAALYCFLSWVTLIALRLRACVKHWLMTLHHFTRQQQPHTSWLTHISLRTWWVGIFQDQWLQANWALINKLVVGLIEWTTRD